MPRQQRGHSTPTCGDNTEIIFVVETLASMGNFDIEADNSRQNQRFPEDVMEDELSANFPTDETEAKKIDHRTTNTGRTSQTTLGSTTHLKSQQSFGRSRKQGSLEPRRIHQLHQHPRSFHAGLKIANLAEQCHALLPRGTNPEASHHASSRAGGAVMTLLTAPSN